MTRPRKGFQVFRDMVELCPIIYTRLLQASRTNTEVFGEAVKHGFLERREEKNMDSTRKKVWMVYATKRGKALAGYVNNMEELLK